MNDQRFLQFEHEVAALDIDNAATRERWLGRAGVALIVVGLGLGGGAYLGSVSSDGPLAQRDMIVLGLFAVSVTVVGVGLFLRYSVVRFFRFWAARLTYEVSRAAATAQERPRSRTEVNA
jgi:hypothetical protein